VYLPTKALHKLQSTINDKCQLLHVSASECHPQGVHWTKEHNCNTLIQVLIALLLSLKY